LKPFGINNINLAKDIATQSGFDKQTNDSASAGARQSSVSRQDLVTIDWAALNPNVALIDCLQPCVRLPADQSDEPGLAYVPGMEKLLLIRTQDGWKMIPVIMHEPMAAVQ
jgi:hypothetical protein